MDPEVRAFITSIFTSVWSIELLLLLKEDPDRPLTPAELVERLRASDAVVATRVRSLSAAGLIVEEDGPSFRYAPASADLARLVETAAEAYRRRPDAVRRLIVAGPDGELTAFAEAFRRWRGKK